MGTLGPMNFEVEKGHQRKIFHIKIYDEIMLRQLGEPTSMRVNRPTSTLHSCIPSIVIHPPTDTYTL